MDPIFLYGRRKTMLPKRDYSMNDVSVFRAKLHNTKYDHLDDDKPSPTWWQKTLIMLGMTIGAAALGHVWLWMNDHPGKTLLIMASLFLIWLTTFYATKFIKSRDLCQICNPSSGRGW
jgi:hypothetical protein